MNSQEQQLIGTWEKRYSQGYFDSQGHLYLYFVQRAEIEPLAKAMAAAKNGLTRHQLRRFFQHCRWIERQLNSTGSNHKSWGDMAPDLAKLDTAVADACYKTDPKVPELFHEFIRLNVRATQNERDFRQGFLRHFEALIGFGQQHFVEKARA